MRLICSMAALFQAMQTGAVGWTTGEMWTLLSSNRPPRVNSVQAGGGGAAGAVGAAAAVVAGDLNKEIPPTSTSRPPTMTT